MALPFGSRVKHAWNAFWNARDPTPTSYGVYTSSYRPDRIVYTKGRERTIIASIFNRISIDVAAVDIRHVKLDKNGRFDEVFNDGLNNCLSIEANIDQTGRAFIQDAVATLLDTGCIAIVPTDTSDDPTETDSYEIYSMRVGRIVEWQPTLIRVDLYNEEIGDHREIWVQKRHVAIVENPFYSVMNEPNSTLQRLIHKLTILDKIDKDLGANKLDMIIQLPYLAKNEAKRRIAEERRNEVERQLVGSQYGIAWIDATEKITQLNRPIENTLLGQIEYLTNQLYAQLGMTQGILDGTADEQTMRNYNSRIIDPLLLAITDEMNRKFLTKTARSQNHAIRYFSDPFRLVPISAVPEIADKLTRNEIMSSNEIRQIIGLKPSDDPSADELRNKNLNKSKNEVRGSNESVEAIVSKILAKMDGKNVDDMKNNSSTDPKNQNEEE